MASTLENFKVLVADVDQQLVTVSRAMLRGMGFSNIQLTTSGTKALSLSKSGDFDFLITDWRLQDMDGISLVNHIRRDPDSANPMMPAIMLTGRREQSDVETARDNGIHEYVIKPFSAKTIYSRLERIVEFPRYFVVQEKFVGPDRRHMRAESPRIDRRTMPMLPQRKPRDTALAINTNTSPKLWMPDFTLKHKLGHYVSLGSIITPAVLNHAQLAIGAATDDSLQWIQSDLIELKMLCRALREGKTTNTIVDDMNEVALTISSRSGTFGYTRASKIAYMLYLFCRKKLQPWNPNHIVVIEKYIEVLEIIFSKKVSGEQDNIVQVIKELSRLTTKFSHESRPIA